MWCNVVSLDVGDWMMRFSVPDAHFHSSQFCISNFKKMAFFYTFWTLLGILIWVWSHATFYRKTRNLQFLQMLIFIAFFVTRSNDVDLHWNQIIKIRDFSAKIQENAEFNCQSFLFYKISYSVRYLNIKNSIEFISKLIT